MKRAAVVCSSLLAAACASSAPPPHPPTGDMWGYVVAADNAPNLEMLSYAPDRPSCEFIRVMAQTRGGMPLPAQRSVHCEILSVRPYREGADSVYWVFSLQTKAEHFATGSSDRSVCTAFREAALKAVQRDDMLSECERVVVKRAS
jgi:hypothetical protein